MPVHKRPIQGFDMNDIPDRAETTPGGPTAIYQRSAYLLKHERAIFQTSLRGDLSRRQLANMIGIPAGTLCRKLNRIARRLDEPMTLALLDPACPLPPDQRALAIQHFVQGQHVRRLAELHNISESRVKSILSYVKGWQKGRGEMQKVESKR